MNRRRRHEWEIIKWWMVFIIDWMKERKLFIRSLFIFSFPSFFYWKIMFSDLIKMIFFFKLGHKRFIDFLWWSCSLSYLAPYQDEWGMEKKMKESIHFSILFIQEDESRSTFFSFSVRKKKEAKQTIGRFCRIQQPFIAMYLSLFPFFLCMYFRKGGRTSSSSFFFLSFFFIFV